MFKSRADRKRQDAGGDAGRQRAAPRPVVPATPPEDLAGWIRLDRDNVFRGWATDRACRERRLVVEILADEEPVGVALADRFDPKLVELGEGDGRYAFALVVPERLRDGILRRFQARVQPSGHSLRCKDDAVRVDADVRVPRLELDSAGLGVASGRVRGGQYSKGTPLELWRGGERLPVKVETRLSGEPHDRRFEVSFPVEAMGAGPLSLAGPGMVEAGLPAAPLLPRVRLEAEQTPEGVVRAQLVGDGLPTSGPPLELRVRASDGSLLAAAALDQTGAALLQLEPERLPDVMSAELAFEGIVLPFLTTPVRRAAGRLTRNSAFAVWDGEVPEGWSLAPGASAAAVVWAQPIDLGEGLAVQRTVTVGVPGVGRRGLIQQRLWVSLSAGETLQATVLARLDQGAKLALRLVGDAGEVLGETPDLDGRGVWASLSAPMTIPRVAPLATLELVLSGASMVELGGVRLGGSAFTDPPCEVQEALLFLNSLLVVATVMDGPPADLTALNGRPARSTPAGSALFDTPRGKRMLVRYPLTHEAYDKAAGSRPDEVRIGAWGFRLDPITVEDAEARRARLAPLWNALAELVAGDATETFLVEGARRNEIQAPEPRHRECAIEQAVLAGDRLLIGGWAAGVAERTTILVEPRTLRYWDLGASAALYHREDASAFLKAQASTAAPDRAGFLFASTLPAASELLLLAHSAAGWQRLQSITPAVLGKDEPGAGRALLRYLDRVAEVHPDLAAKVLAGLPQPMRPRREPPTWTRYGPQPVAGAPRLTVVVLLHGLSAIAKQAVELQRSAPLDAPWVLVNDRPADDAPLRAQFARASEAFERPTVYLSEPGTRSAPAAINLGLAAASTPFVLLVDARTHLRSFDAVARALDWIGERPDAAVIGFRLRYPDGGVHHSGLEPVREARLGGLLSLASRGAGLPYRPMPENPASVRAVDAGLLLVRKSALPDPALDEEFTGSTAAAADLCLRLAATGGRVLLWDTEDAYWLEDDGAIVSGARNLGHAQALMDAGIFTRRWGETL